MDLYDAPSGEFIASTGNDSEEDVNEETNEDDIVDQMERTSTEPSTTIVVTNWMLLEHLIRVEAKINNLQAEFCEFVQHQPPPLGVDYLHYVFIYC
ncbi:hypothetical protein JCGZ_19487 [Jatropha curcas]|uniref:Uncharacterized protein n=1 Tax=Jatropha curcas TaxID=180498 RepID=A0A067L8D3_JATCU|nr:hypothetical protein JCGZ_19487 [Jatropha curcas]